MSLELAIAENTSAVKAFELAAKENTSALTALIGIWTKLAAQGNAVVARAAEKNANGEDYNLTAGGAPLTTLKAEAPKAEAQKPAAEKAAPAPTLAATAAAPAEAAAPAPATDSPSEDFTALADEAVDLALLTKETTGAATRNRAGLVALLGEFGVKRAGEIPEAQWGAFVAKLRSL